MWKFIPITYLWYKHIRKDVNDISKFNHSNTGHIGTGCCIFLLRLNSEYRKQRRWYALIRLSDCDCKYHLDLVVAHNLSLE